MIGQPFSAARANLLMCGIFGYLNFDNPKSLKEIIQIIIDGLNNLAYRGSDSTGISFDDSHRVVVAKTQGSVKELTILLHDYLTSVSSPILVNHIAIGHTRWATHGPPCQANAHPQTSSPSQEFVVVHNGSIDNVSSFRHFLETSGFLSPSSARKMSSFTHGASDFDSGGVIQIQIPESSKPPLKLTSETDTEVIAKICLFVYDSFKTQNPSFTSVAANAFRFMQGSGAIIIKSPIYPSECVACRLASPLVIGFKYSSDFKRKFQVNRVHSISPADLKTFQFTGSFPEVPDADSVIPRPDEIFISSDAQSFASHTTNVMYLENWDIVHFSQKGIEIFSLTDDSQSERTIVTVEPQTFSLPLENPNEMTYSEILQQPMVVKEMIKRYVNFEAKKVIISQIQPFLKRISDSRRIILVGSGSSYNAILAVRPFLESHLSQTLQFEFSCEFNDRKCKVDEKDVIIAVSQSGETADTQLSVRRCKEQKALTIGITNTRGSSLTRLVDFSFYTDAGVERGIASTKTFTANIVALILLTLCISPDCADVSFNALGELYSKISAAIELASKIEEAARRVATEDVLMVCGRGSNYPIAREAAMKLEVLGYIKAISFHEGELKHGPLAMMDGQMKMIFLATVGSEGRIEDYRSTLGQIAARGGCPLVIADADHANELDFFAEDSIVVPKTEDFLQPIVNAVVLQLLAYYVSKCRNIQTDRPRNLAKCATIL